MPLFRFPEPGTEKTPPKWGEAFCKIEVNSAEQLYNVKRLMIIRNHSQHVHFERWIIGDIYQGHVMNYLPDEIGSYEEDHKVPVYSYGQWLDMFLSDSPCGEIIPEQDISSLLDETHSLSFPFRDENITIFHNGTLPKNKSNDNT